MMKTLIQVSVIAWVLAVSACGGRDSADDNTATAPMPVPINPLPLNEQY